MLGDVQVVVVHFADLGLDCGDLLVLLVGFRHMQRAHVLRTLPAAVAERFQNLIARGFAELAVLVVQKPGFEKVEHHALTGSRRGVDFVLRVEHDVVTADVALRPADKLGFALVAHIASKPRLRRVASVQPENLPRRRLDGFTDVLGGHGNTRVVLLDEHLNCHAARHRARHRRRTHDFAYAADVHELGQKPLFLYREVRRHRTRAHQPRGITALTIDEDFAGAQPLGFEVIDVHRAVLHRQHAHRDTIEKLVLAVLDGVISALNGYRALHHVRAVKTAGAVYGILANERQLALSVRAVYKRQLAVVKQRFAGDNHELAMGLVGSGTRISFYDRYPVAGFVPADFAHGARKPHAAQHADSRKRHDVRFLGLYRLTPYPLHFVGCQCLCVNNARAVLYAARRETVRQYFVGRTHVHAHVALVDGLALLVAPHFLAALIVPRNLVKRRASQLRPQRSLADKLVHLKAFADRRQNLARSLCRLDVAVVVGRRQYAHFRANAHQLCQPRFVNRRDVVVHLALLPIVVLFAVLDFTFHAYPAILIAGNEIGVQLPLRFKLPALGLSPFVVVANLRNQVLDKFFVHLLLRFLSVSRGASRALDRAVVAALSPHRFIAFGNKARAQRRIQLRRALVTQPQPRPYPRFARRDFYRRAVFAAARHAP